MDLGSGSGKRERSLIFSALKKSCFTKLMLLPNFAFNVIYTGNKKIIHTPRRMGRDRVIIFLPKSHNLAVFAAKTTLQKQLWQPNVQTFFGLVFGSG